MNRKSLIICLAALGAMLLSMVIAIAVLYHDGDKNKVYLSAQISPLPPGSLPNPHKWHNKS